MNWYETLIIKCPKCGHKIGSMSEKWECRNCPSCGTLVFKE